VLLEELTLLAFLVDVALQRLAELRVAAGDLGRTPLGTFRSTRNVYRNLVLADDLVAGASYTPTVRCTAATKRRRTGDRGPKQRYA